LCRAGGRRKPRRRLLPNYFSIAFINQPQYSPAAPEAPQAESRRPSAGTARYPPAPSAPAKGPAGIDRPGSARERRRGRGRPPIRRRGNAVRKTGVEDRDWVADVLGSHDADKVSGVGLNLPEPDAVLDLRHKLLTHVGPLRPIGWYCALGG
jgi:hypothetical protein